MNRTTGTSVETEVHGKRQLKLLKFGETYIMNTPKLLIRFFPVRLVDWVGPARITCEETGLEVELHYKHNVFGRRNLRSVSGKIINSSSSKTIYEINGHWDRYSERPSDQYPHISLEIFFFLTHSTDVGL